MLLSPVLFCQPYHLLLSHPFQLLCVVDVSYETPPFSPVLRFFPSSPTIRSWCCPTTSASVFLFFFASVVIASRFCSLNHLIRAKKRPNTINRDTSNVNRIDGCLMARLKLACYLHILYNGSRQMVAGLSQVLYWVQLNVLFILICTCKKDVTTHG